MFIVSLRLRLARAGAAGAGAAAGFGLPSKYLCVVFSVTVGVPPSVWRAAITHRIS